MALLLTKFLLHVFIQVQTLVQTTLWNILRIWMLHLTKITHSKVMSNIIVRCQGWDECLDCSGASLFDSNKDPNIDKL